MKKVILVAAGALVLASATAYAQMNHRHAPAQSDHGNMHSQMHGQMHDQMQGQQMHSQMQGQMHGHMHSQRHGRMHAQMHDQMHGMKKGMARARHKEPTTLTAPMAHAAIGAPQAWRFTASIKRCMKE